MRRKETNNKGDSAIDTPVNRLDTHEFFQEALPPPKKPRWTKKEEEILRATWKDTPLQEILELLPRKNKKIQG